jgi:hypothetical protein
MGGNLCVGEVRHLFFDRSAGLLLREKIPVDGAVDKS